MILILFIQLVFVLRHGVLEVTSPKAVVSYSISRPCLKILGVLYDHEIAFYFVMLNDCLKNNFQELLCQFYYVDLAENVVHKCCIYLKSLVC
jgi:hypothetical protein